MATLYTNQHTIPTYGRVSGYCSYSQSNGSTSTTISVSALGEAWMNTSGYASTYTLSGSRTVSITFRGTTYSASISGTTSMNTPSGKAYVYNPYSFSTKTFKVDRASTQKVYDLILKITIGGSTYTGTVSITVPAAAVAETGTIIYNGNGSTGGSMSSQTYPISSGSIYLTSNAYSKTGYTFLGWSLSATATTASYTNGQAWSCSNRGTYTLYAVWKQSKVYTPSKFGTIQVFRSNQNGTQNNDGAYGHIYFTLTPGSYTGGSISIKAYYKYKLHEDDWGDQKTEITIDNNSCTVMSFGGGNLNTEKQYDVRLILEDTYDNVPHEITYTTFISASECVIDITADGKGVGFLGSAPGAGIYIENSPLVDFVIEEGTTTTTDGIGAKWTWRKWKSGYIEAWGWKVFNNQTFSSAGVGYYANLGTFVYPITLTEVPYCLASVSFGNMGCSTTSNLTASSVYVSVWSASNDTRTIQTSVYIKGKYI